MNKLILVKKPNMEMQYIDNVVQLDLCNMAVLEDDISDSDWNFISIITMEKGEKKKQIIKLDDIWQFSLVRKKLEKKHD